MHPLRRPFAGRPATLAVAARGALALAALALAASCAPAAVGTGATVGATSAQERGFQGAMQDTRIRIDINDRWFKASEEIFSQIQLQVQEGRVLLSGSVPDPQTRVDAVRLVWQVHGVQEVINEIEIADHSSLGDWVRDTQISQQLKNKLRFDKEVSSLNYSIEVVNQKIYLIGVAQSQDELDRVIAHAKEIAYVRRLVNYVRVKDDPAASS